MAPRAVAISGLPVGAIAEVHVNAHPDEWVVGTANADGYVVYTVDDSLGDSDVRVTAQGFEPYVQHVRWRSARDPEHWPTPINHQIVIGVDLPSLVPTLPHLEVRGRDFMDQQGQRTVLCGCDAFTAFRQYRDGADLGPFFAESKEIGFKLWRVFFMGSARQNQVMNLDPNEPGFYDDVRPFADLVNAHGVVLLATIFVDAQDVMPIAAVRQTHWQAMAERLRGAACILSGGNEYSKNGFNPGELSDPRMLWSRGSDIGDGLPFRPTGSVMEFHPIRNYPTSLRDTVASPVEIYEVRRYNNIPLLIDEPPRFGTSGSGPEYANPEIVYRFARHYATECAGAVFHNFFGQRGRLLDGPTRECANAWARGMRP